MSKPTLYVQRLSEAAVLPKRGSALAAGWDLAAAKACVVPAKGRAIVSRCTVCEQVRGASVEPMRSP